MQCTVVAIPCPSLHTGEHISVHENKIQKKKNLLEKSYIYRGFVFVKDLIVLGHGHAKYDRRHVFEAMDPFFSFRSLTADVKQSIIFRYEFKLRLSIQNKTRLRPELSLT